LTRLSRRVGLIVEVALAFLRELEPRSGHLQKHLAVIFLIHLPQQPHAFCGVRPIIRSFLHGRRLFARTYVLRFRMTAGLALEGVQRVLRAELGVRLAAHEPQRLAANRTKRMAECGFGYAERLHGSLSAADRLQVARRATIRIMRREWADESYL
jgi:hypothetical protein